MHPTTTTPTIPATAAQLDTTQLVARFIASQDIRPASRELYSRTLQQYFNWILRSGLQLTDITRANVIAYKEQLLAGNLSSLTVASYINSVKRFYEWAEAMKYYPNVAKGVKAPKRKQQFRKQPLRPEQATALMQYYQGKALRDYAIINLLLRTGLRTVEAIRANVEDITHLGGKRVLMVQGKGRDERDNFVLLTDKAYEPIAKYLATRKQAKTKEPLFTSTSNNSKGERLTTRTIRQVAKEGLQAIGLNEKGYTAHSLRHTTAVNILRAGGSLETAQHTLRHTNPATTQIYTATLTEERRLANSGEALLDTMY
jgi:integrase/recombinase XerD